MKYIVEYNKWEFNWWERQNYDGQRFSEEEVDKIKDEFENIKYILQDVNIRNIEFIVSSGGFPMIQISKENRYPKEIEDCEEIVEFIERLESDNFFIKVGNSLDYISIFFMKNLKNIQDK